MITAIEYQLTADDYADAQITHLRKVLGRKIVFAYCIIGLFLLSSLAFFSKDTDLAQQFKPFWIFGGVFTLFTLLTRSGFLYRRQFSKIKALQAFLFLDIDEEGLFFKSSRSEGKIKWMAFETWRESKLNFLLYSQPNLFYIVPKRALGNPGANDFREVLANKIPK